MTEDLPTLPEPTPQSGSPKHRWMIAAVIAAAAVLAGGALTAALVAGGGDDATETADVVAVTTTSPAGSDAAPTTAGGTEPAGATDGPATSVPDASVLAATTVARPAPITEADLQAPAVTDAFCAADGMKSTGASATSLADLDGDGSADGAVVVSCEGGISTSYAGARVLRAADRTPMNVDFAKPDGAVATQPDTVAIEGGTLVVRGTAMTADDPMCCFSLDHEARYSWNGQALVAGPTRTTSPQSSTAELARALNAGDRAAVERIAGPAMTPALLEQLRQYGPMNADKTRCLHSGDEYTCMIGWQVGWSDDLVWVRGDAFGTYRVTELRAIGGGM